MDHDYWETFYQGLGDTRLDYESTFTHWVLARGYDGVKIVDLGCGNGRDSIYFAKNGRRVLAIDQSENAIRIARDNAFRLGLSDLVKFEVGRLDDLFLPQIPGEKLCGYLRFVLHSLSSVEESLLLANLLNNQALVEIFIEARTVNDPIRRKGRMTPDGLLITDHHRRMIDPAELLRSILPGFSSICMEVSSGVSAFGDDDPEVVRLHGRR